MKEGVYGVFKLLNISYKEFMAKEWGLKGGRRDFINNQLRTSILNNSIEIENRLKRKPELGIKATTLEVYDEKGLVAAWKYLSEKNLGYDYATFEKWIREHDERNSR